jgi:ABC-type antimicrobial peptide transport system permease subunit
MTVQPENDVLRTVIGVVSHQRASLAEEIAGVVYLPRAGVDGRTSFDVWAPELSADELASRLSGPLTALAPNSLLTARALTFAREFDDELSEVRIQRPVIIVLGLFAFTLAGVGLFGLVAYLVERRTRDFAICLALGARAADIWRDVVRQSAMPALIGIAIGVGVSWTLEGIAEATMFGWESSGALAMAVVGGALLVVAVLAAAGPARRVLRIDPTTALRAE